MLRAAEPLPRRVSAESRSRSRLTPRAAQPATVSAAKPLAGTGDARPNREVVAARRTCLIHAAGQRTDAVQVAHDPLGPFARLGVPVDGDLIDTQQPWMQPLHRCGRIKVTQRHADRVVEREIQVDVADAPILDKGDIAAGGSWVVICVVPG